MNRVEGASDPTISVCGRPGKWTVGLFFGLFFVVLGVPLLWLVVGMGKERVRRQ